MKTIVCLFALTLFACAQYKDGGDDTPVGPYCGDDACNSDETAESCPVDCAGPDLSVPPPAGSETWACRPGVDRAGNDYVEFNSSYIRGASEVMIVGDCASEAIAGYWTGTPYPADKEPNGFYRLYLKGASTACVLTYSVCSDTSKAECWAQFGLGTFPEGSAVPGPMRWCNGSCACKFSRNPGAHATPLGN